MVRLPSLFLCFITLIAATPCTKDGGCIGSEDEGLHMLQVSSSATHGAQTASQALLQEQSKSSVTPIDCVNNAKPIQVLKDGNTGFSFKSLDVETGKYRTMFTIPFNRVFPRYTDLNSCGINPTDGIAYCTMLSQNKNNYIVRVDDRTIEYVAKIPTPPKKWYNSGAFSPDGVYYISDQKANFLVLKDVDKLTGNKHYKAALNPKLLDMSKAKLTKPKGWHSAADIVVVKQDLGLGMGEYVVVLSKGSMEVAKCDGDGKFTESNVRPYMMDKKRGKWKDTWGAGWTFTGKVFFAHNEGKGVYQVDLKQINLKLKRKTPIQLLRIGKSAASGFNDGANCMNVPDPWKTGVVPIDCTKNAAPMQALRVPGRGYAVQTLDFDKGTYQGVFDIPFSRTSPPFTFLNAIGINPLDSIAYGCLLFKEAHTSYFIVRFDGRNLEFVAKVMDAHDPVAGTFNSKGDFFFMHNTKGAYNPVLFSIPGLDELKGFKDHKNTKLPVYSKMKGLILWRYHHFADLVALKYDLEGSGVQEEYIVSINRENQGVFIDWDADNATASKVTGFKTNDVFKGKQAYNYGAAWNFKGQAYFAANDGLGVVQLKNANFATSKITLEKKGKTRGVVNTDGFNCWLK